MIFEYIRKLVCPFDQIETFVPKKGKILDVGCGHGIFSKILSNKSTKRKILGIDPDRKKIIYAKSSVAIDSNINYLNTKIENINNRKFDCITIIDMLYLLAPTKKRSILKKAHTILNKNGRLILVEIEPANKLFNKFMELEEFLMVNLLKITFSENTKFSFLRSGQMERLLQNLGFKTVKKINIKGTIPYPHYLLVAIKN